MEHEVVILGHTRQGDAVRVTGTIDGGEPGTIDVWWSHLETLPTPAAQRAYLAAAFIARSPPEPERDTETLAGCHRL